MKFKSLFLLAALCLAGVTQAAGKANIDAGNPAKILEIAKGYGVCSLGKDSKGSPKISCKSDGTNYGVYFYGCTDGAACTSIQFATGWEKQEVTLADVNAWNMDKRFSRAYLDEENDPMIEMDVNLEYGVHPDNLDDTFDLWLSLMNQFKKKLIN